MGGECTPGPSLAPHTRARPFAPRPSRRTPGPLLVPLPGPAHPAVSRAAHPGPPLAPCASHSIPRARPSRREGCRARWEGSGGAPRAAHPARPSRRTPGPAPSRHAPRAAPGPCTPGHLSRRTPGLAPRPSRRTLGPSLALHPGSRTPGPSLAPYPGPAPRRGLAPRGVCCSRKWNTRLSLLATADYSLNDLLY